MHASQLWESQRAFLGLFSAALEMPEIRTPSESLASIPSGNLLYGTSSLGTGRPDPCRMHPSKGCRNSGTLLGAGEEIRDWSSAWATMEASCRRALPVRDQMSAEADSCIRSSFSVPMHSIRHGADGFQPSKHDLGLECTHVRDGIPSKGATFHLHFSACLHRKNR